MEQWRHRLSFLITLGDRWRAYWQQQDVEVDIMAERDENGVALIIAGTRKQVYHLTDVMADSLAAQLRRPLTPLCGQPRIEALQEIAALATAEIARIEREHASTVHAGDAGGGESEPD